MQSYGFGGGAVVEGAEIASFPGPLYLICRAILILRGRALPTGTFGWASWQRWVWTTAPCAHGPAVYMIPAPRHGSYPLYLLRLFSPAGIVAALGMGHDISVVSLWARQAAQGLKEPEARSRVRAEQNAALDRGLQVKGVAPA